jgi:hypothetical protein
MNERTGWLWSQKRLNDFLKLVKALSANHSLPVDGKGGGGLHAELPPDIGLLVDQIGVFARIEALVKFLGIQLHVGGKSLEVVFAEGTLILTGLVGEEVVVILPILILVTGALGGFGSPDGLITQEGKVEIAKTNLAGIYVS